MRSILSAAVLMLQAVIVAEAACGGRMLASEHIMHGPVCLPERIERVVVLDPFYNLGMGLELGLPIVGAATSGLSLSPEEKAVTAAIESIGQMQEPNLEIVTRLEPDLILGDGVMQGGNYPILSKIAPTVLVETPDWKAYYRTIATIAGKQAHAEEQLAAYHRRAEGIAGKVDGKTLSFVRIMPGGFQVYVDGPNAYAPFRVLADAGVGRPEYETVSDDTILKRPDWEGLIALKGDVLFYLVGGRQDDAAPGALEAETVGNPLWRLIPAVKNGKAYRVDADTWLGFGGIASAHRVLDDVERHLIGLSGE